MIKLKKAVALTVATGGLLAAGAGMASAESVSQGHATNSPGIGSGNNVQVPVHVPVNATGNHIGVVSILSPVFGNSSVNP